MPLSKSTGIFFFAEPGLASHLFFRERSHRRGASMNASRFYFEGDRTREQIRGKPRAISFEAFASRLYVGIPWTLYALYSGCGTNIRTRALPCLTSKMSHDRSWRAACINTITIPFINFEIHFYSTRRDSCGRWL
jgi:hypothetical protein